MTAREELIADTFVELADTLVADFDVIDFLHTLVERTVALLDADAGGILLADQRGGLEVVAATSHEVRLVELFELQSHEGPCLEAFRTGEAVTRSDLTQMRTSWPAFTARLEQAGFASAQAVPMRLRDEVVGALNVFRVEPGTLSRADMKMARALADVATVGLLQERTIRARRTAGRTVAGRTEQPGAHRAGQGSARRAVRSAGRPGVRRHAHSCPADGRAVADGRRRHRARADTGRVSVGARVCVPAASGRSRSATVGTHRTASGCRHAKIALGRRCSVPAPWERFYPLVVDCCPGLVRWVVQFVEQADAVTRPEA